MMKSIKKESKLKMLKGTKFVSFLFIGISILIGGGILFAANIYFNIDTGEVVTEQIQRVTGNIRATAGLIVGGLAGQDPAAGHRLEVVGSTLFTGSAVLGNIGGTAQELRFLEGGASPVEHVALRAPSGLTTSAVYILPHHDLVAPSPNHILTWQTGGQLEWRTMAGLGAGDITAVGNVSTGEAFTTAVGGVGNALWFEGTTVDDFEIQLTAADPGADRTITLPALTGTVALLSAPLTTGGILFADAGGLIAQDTPSFFWDDANNRLGIGTNVPAHALDVRGAIRTGGPGVDGQIRIFSEQGATDFELVFGPHTTMTANTIYAWPANVGSLNNVLTTDGTGALSWQSVAGVGGVTGTGTANRLARWTGASTIGDGSIVDNLAAGTALTIAATGDITIANNLTVSGAGIHAFAGTLDPTFVAGFTLSGPIAGGGQNITGIGQFAGLTAVLTDSVTAPLFTGTGQVIIRSGTGGELILDSATGIIRLAAADHIQTSGGYRIGAAGDEIVRGVVSVFGFDMPVRCRTACSGMFTNISRVIENDPFPAAYPGTTRRHRFSIRYADATTTASSTWQVATSSAVTFVSEFTVPPSESTSLADGNNHITAHVPLPDMAVQDWFLRVRLGGAGGYDLQVYEIMLMALDEIN